MWVFVGGVGMGVLLWACVDGCVGVREGVCLLLITEIIYTVFTR